MPALSLSELAKAARGKLLRGDPETVTDSFVIDTRLLNPSGAFFALKGMHKDGHSYLGEAAQAGAAVAVVERAPAPDEAAPPALIQVESTETALGRCGGWVRRNSNGTRFIVVSGSNGKTTTKEMIAEGLSAGLRVHRTPGNYNNHLGVPLSLLAMPSDTEVAVLEIAMSGPGEIAALTKMCDPDIGLVTNIRAVHMSAFASIDDVAAAKGEMFAVMREDAIAVVNLDDLHLRVQTARHAGPRVTFGQHPDADLYLEAIENRFVPGATLGFRHDGKPYRLQLRIGGAHAAQNALAALATVVAAGEDLEKASERIGQLEARPGRGKIYQLGQEMMLVDDTYNSNPPALAAVLETLRLSKPLGRRVLILGDMLELGEMETALHREAGRRAATAGVKLLIAVGPQSKETTESARRSGVPEVHQYPDSSTAAVSVAEFVQPGDLIVVKGSRGLQMERVVQALTRAFAKAY